MHVNVDKEKTTKKYLCVYKNTASSFLPRSMTGSGVAVLAQQLPGSLSPFAVHCWHSTSEWQKPFPFCSQLRYGSVMLSCSARKSGLTQLCQLSVHWSAGLQSAPVLAALCFFSETKPCLVFALWHHPSVEVTK